MYEMPAGPSSGSADTHLVVTELSKRLSTSLLCRPKAGTSHQSADGFGGILRSLTVQSVPRAVGEPDTLSVVAVIWIDRRPGDLGDRTGRW